MTLIARLRSFFRASFGRRVVEREMDQEWQFHRDQRTASLVAAGMPRAEAERRARLEFGDPLRWKEQGREARGLRWIHETSSDAQYALRQIRRAPGLPRSRLRRSLSASAPTRQSSPS